MKKVAYILILSIFFVVCSNLSQPNIIEDSAHLMAIQKDIPNSTQDVQAASQVTNKPSTGTFKELYKIINKNGDCINLYSKGNTIYITSSEFGEINKEDLKELKINSDSVSKLLVNKDNPLPKDFTPHKLTNINASMAKLEYTGLKLIPITLNALYSMVTDAKKAGVKGFIINSAYRSLASQKQIFDSNLNSFRKTSKTYTEAYEKTRLLVALPGNSEHHTGLALDIFSVNGRHRSDFEGTKEQVWLNKNLQKYGFIIRYPKDKTKETNSTYESWHIRYVGVPLSTYMKENNLCLEEFYERIFSGQVLENKNSVFLRVRNTEKIYIDKNLVKKSTLEAVNKDNSLLTLTRDD